MIHAFARIHCDHPGCQATRELAEPLRFGQLNPLQTDELKAAAAALGWRARWVEPADEKLAAFIGHYCPDHAPAAVSSARSE